MTEQRPSKSQLKREMHELQALGEHLMELSHGQLEDIDLPEPLREAVMTARQMKKHGALHRQKQYIGRLMRDTDPESIRRALQRVEHAGREQAAAFKRCERWRERLLEEGKAAFEELLGIFPDIDRQHVRRLLREAHREREEHLPPRAQRALFRFLADLETHRG